MLYRSFTSVVDSLKVQVQVLHLMEWHSSNSKHDGRSKVFISRLNVELDKNCDAA